ncbi:phage terminase small subunit-related protein [Bacillus thuringiensis]|uniref:phage terminase small subunit-related protein n=1 Tax=Bacillus thuringiensis TaxID=1428 RepID=UPI002AB52BE5|nr:phage terminase small subunit-related protein [Bacillus thuringiensis]MDY7964976.1 phage terminase small subunit-related protein [Bacillus thuringiensis]
MARRRDPRRDQAKKIWVNNEKSGNENKLVDIAKQIGVPASTIRKWKSQDNWEEELEKELNGNAPKSKESAPINKRNAPKSKGAQPGNKNALGNKGGSAPLGNKNAVGNKGGAAPLRNANAVKTGEYRSLWQDALDDDERQLLQIEEIDPIQELIDAIQLYTYREMFIMKRIKAIREGLTPVQRTILKERTPVKRQIKVEDLLSNEYKTMTVKEFEMVEQSIEETEGDRIAAVLAHEEALTRIQDKKLKAVEKLDTIANITPRKLEIEERKLTILEEKWEKEKGSAGNQQQQTKAWAGSLENIFAKRKAKREGS